MVLRSACAQMKEKKSELKPFSKEVSTAVLQVRLLWCSASVHCGSLSLFVIEKESAAAANVEEVCWVYVKQVSQYMCGQPFDCTSRGLSFAERMG